MKTMTALAAMLLLHACGSAPATGDDAVAANANERSAAVPGEMPPAIGTAATTAASPTPGALADHGVGGERTRVDELAGNWRVTGVRVTAEPVQAVSDDDPALMGAVLSISPERLAWKPHRGGFFTDICPGPQIGPDGSVGCAEGQFGPPEAHLTSEGARLRLDWYDGAVLILSRR